MMRANSRKGMTGPMPMLLNKDALYCPVFRAMTINELIVALIPSPRIYSDRATAICDTCKITWRLGQKPNCKHCKNMWEYIDEQRAERAKVEYALS